VGILASRCKILSKNDLHAKYCEYRSYQRRFQASLRDAKGLPQLVGFPALETPGYFQSPLSGRVNARLSFAGTRSVSPGVRRYSFSDLTLGCIRFPMPGHLFLCGAMCTLPLCAFGIEGQG
jgi:hypothetical protein